MKAKRTLIVMLTIVFVMGSLGQTGAAPVRQGTAAADPVLAAPQGYIHRPLVEFFTGLSCPACMNGPEQEMTQLWEENADLPEQPVTFIAFHELNGGGVDDLQTDESQERMRFYQPGVSGTPDAEFDGGYIELGGVTGTGGDDSINYVNAKNAVDTCNERPDQGIDPRNFRESILNGFKFVNLKVNQVYTGTGFAVQVSVEYLGTTSPVLTPDLNGALYVFMIEDEVTAYSTVMEENVLNHNVFRGYAMENKQITLSSGESQLFGGEWEIPLDATVSVKPGDVTAVAAVFDLDDTSSEGNGNGNINDVPRAIQSATPKSTAYDTGNDVPIFGEFAESFDGKTEIAAHIDDENGIATAWLLYNYNATNSTEWDSIEMEITGEEVCKTDGTCTGFKDATATANIPASEGQKVFYRILAYDANMTEAKSETRNYTAMAGGAIGGGAGISPAVVGVLILVGLAVVFIYWTRVRKTVVPAPETACVGDMGVPSEAAEGTGTEAAAEAMEPAPVEEGETSA